MRQGGLAWWKWRFDKTAWFLRSACLMRTLQESLTVKEERWIAES